MTVSLQERVQSVYLGDGRFEIRAVPASPPPDQVAIAVAYTGLCGTDLHIFHGHMDQRVTIPAVIGHEISGSVAAVGPGVDGLAPGDPVTVMPLDMCGTCPACRAGHQHVCHRMSFLGIDAEGSMQQVWTVPRCRRGPATLGTLPGGSDVGRADRGGGARRTPGEGPARGARRGGRRRAGRDPDRRGWPGEAGAEAVLVELDAGRRELAASLSLRVLDPGDDVVAWVNAWTEDAGADVAFEVSGSAPGVTTAVAVLATRGRLCQVGIHSEPRQVDLHRFFWRELTMSVLGSTSGSTSTGRSNWSPTTSPRCPP
jgi:threonine dehydrogenase-like Zn-dependent dehydrogenase